MAMHKILVFERGWPKYNPGLPGRPGAAGAGWSPRDQMTSIQALFSRVPISLFDLQLIENRFLFSPARLKRGHIPGWPGWWWSRQGALVTDGLDNGTPSPSRQAANHQYPTTPTTGPR